MGTTVGGQVKAAAGEILRHAVARAVTRALILSPSNHRFKRRRDFYCFIGGRGAGKSTLVHQFRKLLADQGHAPHHVAVIGSDIIPKPVRRFIDKGLIRFLHRATADDATQSKHFGASVLEAIEVMCMRQGGPVIMNIHGDQIKVIEQAVKAAAGAGYDTKLIVAAAPLEVIHQRVEARSHSEGRPYDPQDVIQSNQRVIDNLGSITRLFDKSFLIDSSRTPGDLYFLLNKANTPVDGAEHIVSFLETGEPAVVDRPTAERLTHELLHTALTPAAKPTNGCRPPYYIPRPHKV